MTTWFGMAVVAVLVTGCAAPTGSRRAAPAPVAVTAVAHTVAQVTLVNGELRFVVIDYGDVVMPGIGTTVALHRDGAVVAKVRLTEPARGRFVTGDILDGDPRVGDEAR